MSKIGDQDGRCTNQGMISVGEKQFRRVSLICFINCLENWQAIELDFLYVIVRAQNKTLLWKDHSSKLMRTF